MLKTIRNKKQNLIGYSVKYNLSVIVICMKCRWLNRS